ncbi:hypothetical protein BDA96_02G347600 [Sorghum bicolor]|uniref:Uncharacterized protein n=1 Tax=Sorghum bicolor TaxID=4558 RepID=A0A921RSH2_SORBI|nr:hypothetical protein BDA96_02G347600 [Sorghum bicolor]
MAQPVPRCPALAKAAPAHEPNGVAARYACSSAMARLPSSSLHSPSPAAFRSVFSEFRNSEPLDAPCHQPWPPPSLATCTCDPPPLGACPYVVSACSYSSAWHQRRRPSRRSSATSGPMATIEEKRERAEEGDDEWGLHVTE